MADLLNRIETYYDAAPRSAATTEEIGPFTLFVPTVGWPYYARPRLGVTGPFTVDDVAAVRARQRDLGVPESFEWVAETTPALLEPMTASGCPEVHHYPLMVLDRTLTAQPPAGVRLRMLDADSPDLDRARAVADVGFAHLGTATGEAGAADRDEAAASTTDDGVMRDRIRRGLTLMAVAEDDDGPLAVGSVQPVGDVAEVVGVATLPTARRRGLGAAVTALLVDAVRDRGVDLVFLSAGGDDVARVYAKVGFRRIGTAHVAEI